MNVMARPTDRIIVFHVEPADTSVGIMTEGFSAWIEGATSWCHLEDIEVDNRTPAREKYRFAWYDNETGLNVDRPAEARLVEGALQGYINAWYYGND